MESIKKLAEAITESNDAKVIAQLLYEQNCPSVHKEIIEVLLNRFFSEIDLIDRWNAHSSDACNLECSDYEMMNQRFNDWLKLDQLKFSIGTNQP